MNKEEKEDKDIMRIISGLGGNYIAEEIIKRSKDKNIIYMTTDIILDTNCVKELANYIEQLQKENEELKQDNKTLCEIAYLGKQVQIPYTTPVLTSTYDFISKDKIRNKIKELEASYKKYEREGLSNFIDKLDIGTRIEVLKELLGDE